MLKSSSEFTDGGIEAFVAHKDSLKEAYSAEDIALIQSYGGMGKQATMFSKKNGLPFEPYTPPFVVELMWKLARHHGYRQGAILEPSIGTGRMLQPLKDHSNCIGFEINPVSARIAELCYPEASIYNYNFETAFLDYPMFSTKLKHRPTWLPEYPFSLAIGRPPFGVFNSPYKNHFPEAKALIQKEIFFMYKCLQLLKSNGLLVFLMDSNFLRNGDTFNSGKAELAKFCDFVDAYRLPDVFPNSHLLTDIIVLKRK